MGILKPASFKAGRKISFGEQQGALVAPTLVKGATADTGGTFNAGDVFWVLTAIDADGETVASNEVTATMGAESTQTVTWAAVTGATGYKLYRGTTTGSYTKRVVTLGLVTTYTDLGNAGTSAHPPTVATDAVLVTYAPGDTIPNATIKGIKHLSALLSNRSIIPNVDPFHRKGKSATPTPTDLSPKMKGSL